MIHNNISQTTFQKKKMKNRSRKSYMSIYVVLSNDGARDPGCPLPVYGARVVVEGRLPSDPGKLPKG